jgi:hypothetical protein
LRVVGFGFNYQGRHGDTYNYAHLNLHSGRIGALIKIKTLVIIFVTA